MANPRADKSQVYVDGMCNLCNFWVKFILPRDRRFRFQFGALQSSTAQKTLAAFTVPAHLDSVVVVDNGKLYTRSSAILMIARRMGGAWQVFYAFILIPPWIRDALYDWVARNRHKWFGRSSACMIPPAEWADRFLD